MTEANRTEENRLSFTMGDGAREMFVEDGNDHIRVVIRQGREPHEWYYLDRAEILKLKVYLTNWVRTHG